MFKQLITNHISNQLSQIFAVGFGMIILFSKAFNGNFLVVLHKKIYEKLAGSDLGPDSRILSLGGGLTPFGRFHNDFTYVCSSIGNFV